MGYNRDAEEAALRQRFTADYHRKEQKAWEDYRRSATLSSVESPAWKAYLAARSHARTKRNKAFDNIPFLLDLKEGAENDNMAR